MQVTICAKVNPRLLGKADRLFTGTVEGRIIEILQNARRAGATEVRITNEKGFITVEDNGSGIGDFQKLLDLGGSGWDEKMEAGEDPAGVGLFSLAPGKVMILSGDRKIVIEKDGWTGKPVKVIKNSPPVEGTLLKFKDEKAWAFGIVEKYAVFTGLKVIVDGKRCQSIPFCTKEAVTYEKPGCRIEITRTLSNHHRAWTTHEYHGRILVNFHGQVVQLDHWPGKKHENLEILVDITDQTNIRLMLPARTKLVENKAFKKLINAIEREYYRYYKKRKTHTLYYDEYLRARELGIDLPEAQPQFKAGLIWSEYNEPVEVVMPKDFKLEDCYLCSDDDCKDDLAETNAHLLAAFGTFKEKPFIPVTIDKGYMGYSWSQLPKVMNVEIARGQELLRDFICGWEITCFDKLSITLMTSDGMTFSSDVDLAVVSELKGDKCYWTDEIVCVHKRAAHSLSADNVWFHMGGYSEDGDCYDTQLYDFEQELHRFWNKLLGPYETMRQQLLRGLSPLYEQWQKVIVLENGVIEIFFKDGRKEQVSPPA